MQPPPRTPEPRLRARAARRVLGRCVVVAAWVAAPGPGGHGTAAPSDGTQGPPAAGPAGAAPAGAHPTARDPGPAVDLGPVAYRVIRLEALRFRVPRAHAEAPPPPPELGTDGAWTVVPRDRPPDGDDLAADAALLADLVAADGPLASATTRERGAPPDRADASAATVWALVATWEASALVVIGDGTSADPPVPRVARARRAVASPLPPPDLRAGSPPGGGPRAANGPTPPRPAWPPAACTPPPPHPDPTDVPSRGRVRGREARPPPARRPIATGLALARAGDPVGAAAWFAREAERSRAADDGPPHVVVLRRAWEAEVALATGRAAEAVHAYDAARARVRAAAVADAGRAGRWADVEAHLRERVAVAAWRAEAARRGPGLASGPASGAGVGPAGGAAGRPPLDARGDARLGAPPGVGIDAPAPDVGGRADGPREGRGDGAREGALARARRHTWAWWRARR